MQADKGIAMKGEMRGVLACMLVLAGTSSASDPRPQAKISPLGECLVANQVTAWGVVDERRLVVKSLGKRYYDIQLSHDCPDLNRRPYLSFRDGSRFSGPGSARHASPGRMMAADGRICGDIGDAVVPRGGVTIGLTRRCDIRSMHKIDEATFERVFELDPDSANQMLDGMSPANAGVAAN